MKATDAFQVAVEAIVGDDHQALWRLLAAHSDVVYGVVSEEAFIEAIVHQVYAGDTLLHLAAAGFRREMTAYLLGRGADVAARNRRGAQALHYAADGNRFAPDAQVDTIWVLLRTSADPNAVDTSGTAPLHRAVRTRSAGAVEALLEGGADPNLKNGSGSTPLFLARRTTGRGGTGEPWARAQQAEIIQLLLEAGGRD